MLVRNKTDSLVHLTHLRYRQCLGFLTTRCQYFQHSLVRDRREPSLKRYKKIYDHFGQARLEITISLALIQRLDFVDFLADSNV